MSMFDAYTTPETCEKKRLFLRLPKANFLRAAGLATVPAAGRQGRLPRYDEDAIRALDDQVNAKAVSAETADTLVDRIRLARDYLLLSDAALARKVGVSREAVRHWLAGTCQPSNIEKLAEALQVPLNWLVSGGENNLPADSVIGLRVGTEAMAIRDELHSKTQLLVLQLADDSNEQKIQSFIETTVKATPELAMLARRAGGRWQYLNVAGQGSELLFAPWVPLVERGLSKRLWSDEVETLIDSAMATDMSIYAVWHWLKATCEARGLAYPAKITLYKRLNTARDRIEKFGIDLNEVIARACLSAA